MSRVFVIQNVCWKNPTSGQWESKYDLTPAEQYGELVFLLEPDANPFNAAQVTAELMARLGDYGDDDHLLLIGNPALIGLAVATAAAYNDGKVRLLQCDRRRRYIPVQADLPIFR